MRHLEAAKLPEVVMVFQRVGDSYASVRDPDNFELSISRLIDSIGTESFGSELLSCLSERAGVEHFAIYCIDLRQVKLMAAESANGSNIARINANDYLARQMWQSDQGFLAAMNNGGGNRAEVIRVSKSDSMNHNETIPEKLFIYGGRRHSYGISVLRSRNTARFSDQDKRRLKQCGDIIVSCCDKHIQQVESLSNEKPSLESLELIEVRLAKRLPSLTKREMQVCARMLYGRSSPNIALDLGIQNESVITYKKRAFIKASISSKQELLNLFLQSSGWDA